MSSWPKPTSQYINADAMLPPAAALLHSPQQCSSPQPSVQMQPGCLLANREEHSMCSTTCSASSTCMPFYFTRSECMGLATNKDRHSQTNVVLVEPHMNRKMQGRAPPAKARPHYFDGKSSAIRQCKRKLHTMYRFVCHCIFTKRNT